MAEYFFKIHLAMCMALWRPLAKGGRHGKYSFLSHFRQRQEEGLLCSLLSLIHCIKFARSPFVFHGQLGGEKAEVKIEDDQVETESKTQRVSVIA